METVHLGRSGLLVSRLCLGTMNFGPFTSEIDAFAIMDKAVDSGINFFDTANMYGRKQGEGVTERIVGRWLEQDRRRRDRIVLATKVYGKMGDGPNDRRLSAYHIRRACEESLSRLHTDHIDLFQMHHIDRETPWEEIWQAMELLVQQGKVLYVGSSNFAGWHIIQAQCEASSRHFMGLISEQSLYNLMDRMIELEVIPACRALGLGLMAWSPLAGGLLASTLRSVSEGRRADEKMKTAIDKHCRQLEAYSAFCDQLGRSPGEVALAWVLHNPTVSSAIIGPRTMEQFSSCLGSMEIKLSPESMKQLDEIWPGPGGEAPEAYAW